MKTTIFKRIRLGIMLLCVALIAASVIPVVAFADNAAGEQDSVHFINPTAITILGDYLYVADIVEDNKTAILCFSLEDDTPTLVSTTELNERVTNLSSGYSDLVYDELIDRFVSHPLLYVTCGTKIIELSLANENELSVTKTYEMFEDRDDVQIISVASGAQFRMDKNTLYALTSDKMLYLSAEQNKFIQFSNIEKLQNTKGCYIIEENGSSYLYYVANNTCARFNISSNGADTAFSNNLSMSFTPNGIFGGTLDNKEFVGVFNSNGIFKIEGSGSAISGTLRYDTISMFKDPNEVYVNDSIVAVEMYNQKLVVLNSRNQIDIFELSENGFYYHQPATTIGSDMIDKAVPAEYTGFTLVRPNGYPANIVYKTNADTSISDIITDAKEYIIIDYDGSENSHYYYVMVGDKFGWVKRSDNAKLPAEDNKLTVVKNNPSGVEGFVGETKFVSPNAVYVYKLPLESSEMTTVTQSASTMKTVTVLQEYKEGDITWYYVSYDEGKTGFVKNSDIGPISYAAKTPPTVVDGMRKINSSLFAAVNVYRTSDLTEGDYVASKANDTAIKLYSGDRVTLIETRGNAAFVMIEYSSDHSKDDYGWIEANRLIGVHDITTNAIVGLSLLAVAIALTTVLLIVYFKRKKKIKRTNA